MRFLSLLLLFCFSISAQAVIVSDLYEVQLRVEDQSLEVRTQAIQDALQQVFIKVSGTKESLNNELLQAKNDSALTFVESYRYQSSSEQLLIVVQFIPKQVNAALTQAGLPIWGKSRPLLLIWQADEYLQQRRIVNYEAPQVYSLIEEAMNERGIPILWPSLDLEDQIALPIGHLWGLFHGDIEKASSRYLTDAFIAGKLYQNAQDLWQYQGFLQLKQDSLSIQLAHEDQHVLIHQLADQIASFLSEHYAVTTNLTAEGQQISVTGVQNFASFQQLLEYLRANVAIKQVSVVTIDKDTLTLSLQLSTDWQKVWQNLAFDKRLQETDNNLVYHWSY